MQSEDYLNRLRALTNQQNVPLKVIPAQQPAQIPQQYAPTFNKPSLPVQQVKPVQLNVNVTPNANPSYPSLGARISDIFNANSPQDIAKRLAANQQATYEAQKISQGERPLSNLFTQAFAPVIRPINTVSSFVQQLPSTAKIITGLATGNRPAAERAAQQLAQIQERTLAPKSGLFGVGTVVPSNQALGKMKFGDVLKTAAGAGAELASFAVGGGELPTLAKIAGKEGLKQLGTFVAKEAVAGALAGGGGTISRKPSATGKEIATGALTGAAIGAPLALTAGLVTSGISNALSRPAGKALVAKLTETTDQVIIKDTIRELLPNATNEELNNLSSRIAKSTSTTEIDNILRTAAENVPTTAVSGTAAEAATLPTTPVVQQLTDTLAKTTDVAAIKDTVRSLLPQLNDAGQTQFAEQIAKANTPEAVTNILDRAEAASKAVTQGIEQVTPQAPSPIQRQAEAAAKLVEQPPTVTTTPKPPVESPVVTPTPSTVQGAVFNAVDKNVPIPSDVTNYETLGGQFQRAFVDKDAPLINYAKQLEKQTGEKGLVDQVYYVTGLQRRANSIANDIIQSSENLRAALEGLTNVTKGEFDIYVAARNELSNASKGLKTSRPVAELKALVEKLAPEYADRFTSLNKYYQDWAGRMRQAGLIDEKTYQSFISNPDYTRIQRVMDDLAGPPSRGGSSYTFGTPSARQKRTGSLREIQPADITAFDYAQRIQKEIQRNETASTIIDLLQKDNATRQVPASQAARKNTIRRVVDGKTQIWEVPRDIKILADNVTPFQLGVLQKVISYPKRITQAGLTGINPVFTVANFGKDILSSAAFTKRATSDILNPVNILSGLKVAAQDTLGGSVDNALWDKFISVSGNTTSYDFLRNIANAKETSRELRLGKIGKLQNMGGSPIRTLEDLNSITEKATRFTNFKAVYKSVLKETGDANEAMRQATLAAWQNSVDFNRMGNVTQVLNLVIPYFNSAIQGSRLIGRRFVENPGATSAKILGLVGLPMVGTVLYNQSDPNRKAVYDNISEYEKRNNFIIVLPGAKQKSDGSYEGVIKIPLQQGLSNLVDPIRHFAENYAGQVPLPEAQKMLGQFVGAFTGPVDTGSVNGIINAMIPQAIKPALQQVINKDLFTGKEIVPGYIQEQVTAQGKPLPESQKAFKYTSGTARAVGNRLGVSPIRVEKFIKDTTGKVGQYVLNAADNILAKAGVIPNEQIGGISIKDEFTRRFVTAQGDYNYQKPAAGKYYDAVNAATKDLTPNEKNAFNALHPQKTNILGEDIFNENKKIMQYAKAGIYLQFPKVFEAEKAIEMSQRAAGNPANPLFDLTPEQLTRVLLKATLPPGAKDPELSNLYQQEWYQDFNAKRDQYYAALQAKMSAQGKSLPKSDNPYPTTPPQLQQAMNAYSALPKGTGARSAWIQANPDLWQQMTNQWSAVDAWENKQRVAMGLSPISPQTVQSFGYSKSSPEYKAALAALAQVKPLEALKVTSAAPRQIKLKRVSVPVSRRTARIRLR